MSFGSAEGEISPVSISSVDGTGQGDGNVPFDTVRPFNPGLFNPGVFNAGGIGEATPSQLTKAELLPLEGTVDAEQYIHVTAAGPLHDASLSVPEGYGTGSTVIHVPAFGEVVGLTTYPPSGAVTSSGHGLGDVQTASLGMTEGQANVWVGVEGPLDSVELLLPEGTAQVGTRLLHWTGSEWEEGVLHYWTGTKWIAVTLRLHRDGAWEGV